MDRLGKCPITILVQDTIIVKELALLFLTYIIRYIGILEIVVSNRGP
jgi:hypothetical protein